MYNDKEYKYIIWVVAICSFYLGYIVCFIGGCL